MPYTSPATVVTGTTITSAWGNSVKAATDFLANPPACRVRRTTAQSIPHNADTVVTFDAERFDTDTMHSTVTNTSRITFTTAGLYTFKFSGELAAASDYNLVHAWFRLNGTTPIDVGDGHALTSNLSGALFSAQGLYKFAAADYIEVMVKHVNGAAAARNLGSTANYSPECSACWIGTG